MSARCARVDARRFGPLASRALHARRASSRRLDAAYTAERIKAFGSPTARYAALHLRMGDGANGSAFAKDSVPTRHKVLNHRMALGAVRCAKRRAGGLPLLVATDNAAFKVCAPRSLVISHSACRHRLVTVSSRAGGDRLARHVDTPRCSVSRAQG